MEPVVGSTAQDDLENGVGARRVGVGRCLTRRSRSTTETDDVQYLNHLISLAEAKKL